MRGREKGEVARWPSCLRANFTRASPVAKWRGSLAVEMRATETVDTVLLASNNDDDDDDDVGVSRVCGKRVGNTPNSPHPPQSSSLLTP